jgi:hypothetical protein
MPYIPVCIFVDKCVAPIVSGPQAWSVGMPRGPQGQRRPADVIGTAVTVAKIATGEIEESKIPPKSTTVVARGRRGGARGGPARADKLSPEERHRIAAHAARTRWGGKGNAGNGSAGGK